MTKTITLEGDMATVDAVASFTTQGSVTAPTRTVPAGSSKIARIIVSAISDGLADGASVFVLRLGGAAVQGGEQTLVVGAHGRIAVQSGSDAAPAHTGTLTIEDVGIEVKGSEAISVQMEMTGSDTGTSRGIVTLVFE